MDSNREVIFRTCQQIAQEHNLEVCVTESVKGALMAGAGSLIGGLCFGPVGMAIGGAAGGTAGAYTCKKYVPLCGVLLNLSPEQKILLTSHMIQILRQIEYTDVVALMAVIASAGANDAPRQLFIQGLNAYFHK